MVVATACLSSACVSSHRAAGVPPAAAGPRSVYVAVGASETVGVGAANPIRESWPQVLYRTAMPAGTVFYDLGVSGSTVSEAVDQQLPEAVRLRPTIATVWLNVNDVAAFEDIGSYEKTLRTLVHALRRGGATAVFVANTPPIEALPVVARMGIPASFVTPVVDRSNAAIAGVCDEEGATVVDLHAAGQARIANGAFPSLISGDGFHPSTAGHAAVAAIFAAAIRSAAAHPKSTTP